MKVPVILLDCDLRNTEGIIYSFGKRKIPIIGLSSTPNPPAFHSRYLRKKLHSPSVAEEQAYLDFLLGLEERGVIVYSDDGSAEFVAKHQEQLKAAGFLVSSPDFPNFRRGFEKDRIWKECEAAGVPTIRTFEINTFEDLQRAWDQLGEGELILKPTKLTGGQYYVVRKEKELRPAYEQMVEKINAPDVRFKHSRIIAQEFLHYSYTDLYSCDAYYNPDSVAVGFTPVRKDRPDINRDGTPGTRLYAGITIVNERLERYTKSILDHLEWKGFAHVEYIYSPKYQDYLLCEVNPRLPGFSNYFTKIGFETAWYYYADLVGLSYPPPSFRKSVYYEALRIPGDLTNGFYSMIKGYLTPGEYIRPYLRIFYPGYQVCFDVFFKTDPGFTLAYWGGFLKYLIRRPFRALLKK